MALSPLWSVECQLQTSLNDPAGICSALTSGTYNPVVNPEQQRYVISTAADAALIDEFLACGGVTGCASAGVPAPIDYASLGAIWTFGFVSVLILWLVAKNAGIIVDAVRRF